MALLQGLAGLKRPLTLADVKHMLLGHWGTTPGQNFIYVHLNRVIKKYDLNMVCISGPGHGGLAVLARITRQELEHLMRGYGWTPYFVEGDEPEKRYFPARCAVPWQLPGRFARWRESRCNSRNG